MGFRRTQLTTPTVHKLVALVKKDISSLKPSASLFRYICVYHFIVTWRHRRYPHPRRGRRSRRSSHHSANNSSNRSSPGFAPTHSASFPKMRIGPQQGCHLDSHHCHGCLRRWYYYRHSMCGYLDPHSWRRTKRGCLTGDTEDRERRGVKKRGYM